LQDTRRGNWSDEELAQIKDLVEKSGNNINWQQIGAELSRCENKPLSNRPVNGCCCCLQSTMVTARRHVTRGTKIS
jgi:hypothetical protein